MNKDTKLRRVEDARLQHLYNNFSDATALYTTTAVPFDVKPVAVPVLPVPNSAMTALQLPPMAQSASVHPFLQSSLLAASAQQQQEEAWKRAGLVADAQQQLLQAQMQYHITQNALNMQHQQQQQQQQQQQAAVNSFLQSVQVTPTASIGITSSTAAPLTKSSSTSAFHSVIPASQSSAASNARVTSGGVTSAVSNNGGGLLSPSLSVQSAGLVDMSSLASTSTMHMRPIYDTTRAFSTPALSFPQMPTVATMGSLPASPAVAAHSLLSPVRRRLNLRTGRRVCCSRRWVLCLVRQCMSFDSKEVVGLWTNECCTAS